MEVHQLRYLDAVARTGHFTRAARDCHVTQPTLSHQIRKLEQEMGGSLLRRGRDGARLTTLGEKVRVHARSVLASIEAARLEASSLARVVEGPLRLGAIPTVAPYFLPRLLRNCRSRFPGLVFSINESPTRALLDGLVRGELDAIVISPPVKTALALTLRPIFEDEFLLALPKRHPLAGEKRIALAQLQDEAVILLGDAHCLRGQALALCRRAGFAPRVALQSAQLDTVLGLVEAGLGLSFIPACALDSLRHRKVVFKVLRPARPARQVAIAWAHPLVPLHVLEAVVGVARESRSTFRPESNVPKSRTHKKSPSESRLKN